MYGEACVYERERAMEEDQDCLKARMHREQLRKSPIPHSHLLCYIRSFAFQLAGAWNCALHGCPFPDKLEEQVKQAPVAVMCCLIFDQSTSKIITTAILYLQTASAHTVS